MRKVTVRRKKPKYKSIFEGFSVIKRKKSIFEGFSVIKRKKSTQRGVPHYGMRKYYLLLSDEDRKIKSQRISKALLAKHASRSDILKNRMRITMTKSILEYYKTRDGREKIEYMRYYANMEKVVVSPEKIQKRFKAMREGIIRHYKTAKPRRHKDRFIEKNVPRIANYCGVVKETHE